MPASEAAAWIDERLAETVPRVLIVDNKPEIRQLVAQVLADYVDVQASDGREALDLAQRERPNLVITDVRMPKMDGLTLLGHLKDEYPDMPVLGISGYVDADVVEKKGFDGCLTKPMSLRQLKTMVQDSLA